MRLCERAVRPCVCVCVCVYRYLSDSGAHYAGSRYYTTVRCSPPRINTPAGQPAKGNSGRGALIWTGRHIFARPFLPPVPPAPSNRARCRCAPCRRSVPLYVRRLCRRVIRPTQHIYSFIIHRRCHGGREKGILRIPITRESYYYAKLIYALYSRETNTFA